MDQFTYSEAETLLAKLFQANPQVQTRALRGRLKHLKRLGVPLGINPGTGHKVLYGRETIYQWAFCLELAEFGIDPSAIVAFVKENWEEILVHFKQAESHRGDEVAGDNQLCFAVNPRLMSSGWVGDLGTFRPAWFWTGQPPQSFRYAADLPKAHPSEKLGTWLRRLGGPKRRAIVVNISDLVNDIGQLGVIIYSTRRRDKRER